MGTTVTVLAVTALVMVVGWYLSFSAARLDRLHARTELARSALDAQLVRRASVALELATSGRLDPASGILVVDAAHRAREASADERELAESDLSRVLRLALEDPDVLVGLTEDPWGRTLRDELDEACRRVELARRFHNDAVRSARVVRRQRLVRLFRLAGRAGLPESFEMDDAPPRLTPTPA